MHGSRIAVVGGGVAGLSAAWLLSRSHEVTLFEANDYVGGHTNTVDVPGPAGTIIPVDTGFIVYNERNYPHLAGMFRQLGIRTQQSDMSFAFSSADTGLEWAGDSFNTLFAQRHNLLNPAFWRMTADILRFNHRSKRYLREWLDDEQSLGEYLDAMGASRELRENYLLPMAAAIWSCPQHDMLAFPAYRFLRFFNNHGLIDLFNRPRWRTVSGGAREYVRRMLPEISGGYVTGMPIRRIQRTQAGVRLHGERGEIGSFDQVVVAAHADQALGMLDQPHFWERTLLSSFTYQPNDAWLHTDPALMPQLRKVWASWNYLANPADAPPAVTYWMNRLQALPGQTDYFVTLNPDTPPDPGQVLRRVSYDHPVFDNAAMRAQRMLHRLQGRDRIWFCGSYFGFGFHEDALKSSVDICLAMGAEIPWTTTAEASADQRGGDRRHPEGELQVS